MREDEAAEGESLLLPAAALVAPPPGAEVSEEPGAEMAAMVSPDRPSTTTVLGEADVVCVAKGFPSASTTWTRSMT